MKPTRERLQANYADLVDITDHVLQRITFVLKFWLQQNLYVISNEMSISPFVCRYYISISNDIRVILTAINNGMCIYECFFANCNILY